MRRDGVRRVGEARVVIRVCPVADVARLIADLGGEGALAGIAVLDALDPEIAHRDLVRRGNIAEGELDDQLAALLGKDHLFDGLGFARRGVQAVDRGEALFGAAAVVADLEVHVVLGERVEHDAVRLALVHVDAGVEEQLVLPRLHAGGGGLVDAHRGGILRAGEGDGVALLHVVGDGAGFPCFLQNHLGCNLINPDVADGEGIRRHAYVKVAQLDAESDLTVGGQSRRKRPRRNGFCLSRRSDGLSPCSAEVFGIGNTLPEHDEFLLRVLRADIELNLIVSIRFVCYTSVNLQLSVEVRHGCANITGLSRDRKVYAVRGWGQGHILAVFNVIVTRIVDRLG